MTKQIVNIGQANKGNGDPIRTAFDKVNQNFTELYNAIGLGDGSLNIGAFEFTGSTMTTTDSSDIIIAQRTQITSNLTVGGDILPSVANGGDLGSAAKPWRSLYVSGSTIYIGGNSLGLDNNGNLAWNGSIVAHADGEFIRLDALTDINAPNPNAGDTIAWMGSQYVNVPLREDRLHSEGDEVVLVGGANPYVTFPAITGGDQLIIQGAEVSSVSGSLALTSQNNLYIIANGSGAAPGGSKSWTFGDDGSLTVPGDIRSEQAINIDINLSDSTLRRWTFGEDGVLNAPASSGLYNANLFDIRSQSNYTAWVRTSGQIGLASINSTGVANVAKVEAISTQPAHVDITVESSGQGPKVWSFGFDGSVTFPVGNSYLKENAYDFSINTLSYDDETTLSWTFDRSGSLTLPGELHGSPVISGGAFPSQVGRTVNITPADDASDKKFKFRIDQYGETFTRAYLEFPTAEVDKQVAAVFPHTNGKAGYIYTQGADTNGQGMNDAFNIFYNSGDIKITSMGLSGGLYTWKFGDSGDLTIPGDIQSEEDISIRINLADSTTRTWRFGEDGDLTFPDNTVQTTAYTGNAATVDVMNTNGIDYNYSITFVENRSATQDLRADVDLTFNSWSNTLTTGNVVVKQTITGGIIESGSDFIITSQSNPDRDNACNIGIFPGGATGTASEAGFVSITGGSSDVVGLAGGDVYIRGGAHTNGGIGGTIKVESILKIDDGVHEKFQTKADATGVVTHDCASGHVFYHTSPDADWTVNLTNLNLSSGYATAVTLIIVQGGTGYYPSAVQIGGVGQTLNWQGNTTPTPSTNRTDVVTFSIINNSGTYTVLGQLTGF